MDEGQNKRSRKGRPPLPPEDRRTRRLDIDLTSRELAEIADRAAEAGEDLRRFVREAALKARSRPRAAPPSPEVISLARTLAGIAQDLRALREGIAAGCPVGVSADLLSRLHQIAEATGPHLLGSAANAR